MICVVFEMQIEFSTRVFQDFFLPFRLETQAGTYVKEFVHGDFGRTRPSLANLLGVENGEVNWNLTNFLKKPVQVDILELDVEKVDQVWPPKREKPHFFP